MHANEPNDEKQPAKRSAFTLMNNIRDHCQQSDPKKVLLFTLATYCDGKAVCWPGNEELVKVTHKSERTIRRMLSELKEGGEIDVLTPGTGRGQKRKISLRRYAKPDKAMTAKPDKAMTALNRSSSLGKTSRNSHIEQPLTYSLSASDKGHSQFVRLWCERFEAVTGERYAFQGGKDGKAVKLLLTTTGLTPSQLVAIAEKAWKRPTGFWSKFATSIAGYNSHFNQIRKETTDAMAITTSGRDAGRLACARRSQYAGVGKLR